jgi:Flp pilus assembly pilin Flp|tara:strand:+ start:630 stop:800 length:171 start_codon:yes stop_codon:yes gene_type:complete
MTATFLKRLKTDARGASSVEYGLLICLMTILLIAGISAVGVETTNHFDNARAGFEG